MTAKPWAKWYFADFRSDPRLRMCCRSARSLWLDILGLMHEAVPYGHLLINGKNPSVKQIASVLGDPEKEVAKWLEELESNGVFSRRDDGVIYSRRMVRDAKKAEKDKANGKGGGNPKLVTGVNPPVKAHMSEARDLGPSALNRRPEARASASPGDGLAASLAPAQEPGWERLVPKWAEFRELIGHGPWSLWFQRCQTNGANTTLIAPSTFERDEIGKRYFKMLCVHFGEEVTIKTETGGAYAGD